ncbi:MAG: hypothetical protein JF607_14505 [Burkholderiales bacterium]|nr:hypothetical protein [Burkholderiales bacterium]MBW8893423.1 hypothetical protein [Burkholderiales bacterium]
MAGTVSPGERALNKLLLGGGITIAALLVVPGILALAGVPGAPSSNGWWILVAACVAMLLKLVASETATGEIEFYKFGYDSCITTLGATISAGAIQLYSDVDVYPGMAKIGYLPTFGLQGDAKIRTAQLIGFFVLTWLVAWVTARICGGIKRQEIDSRGGKAMFCAFVGPFFLFAYALILASKKG